jgi:two-component system, OmpR family, phosphate regulon sensor histidine kinase PhoR
MTTGLLPRLLAGLLVFGLGGLIGFVAGGEIGALVGALLGGLLAFLAVVVVDAVRGWRLMRWLRESHQGTAPRDSGFWGELAYRIERSLRGLEREAEVERTHLTQFVAAMEASPNGVLLLDGNDQIEWCNSRAADHFGLDPERDRRQRVTNLIRSPAFVDYLQAGNFEEPVAVRDPRRKGSLQVLIRRYGAGSKLVISQDLTERERADVMRRDFVANVSHEIRTPLTVLSGFLETMRNLPLTEVERKRVLTLMTQQAERMGHLVGDLLTLAQLEGSPRPAGDKWVRLAGLFGQVEAEARALSAGRHTIVFAEPGEARIAGNESELLSAIGNLVNNAVRYTPDGGRIDVGWKQIDNNGMGEILVTDTGRGIAREHLSRLGERFYRVDSSRSRESGGTGLGLAIVKHVIQRHGGELDVASESGKGSTFRLLVPAARVRSEPPAAAAQAAEAVEIDATGR